MPIVKNAAGNGRKLSVATFNSRNSLVVAAEMPAVSILLNCVQLRSTLTNSLTLVSIPVHFAVNYLTLRDRAMKFKNNVRKIREERLMSKAELARLAGVSPATVDRIERGEECRMETKRKIILAFGFSLSEREEVFLD